MNLKCRLILESYQKQRDDFVKLGDVVQGMLADIVKDLGLTVLAIEHRVKEKNSLAGKLERKGDGYNSLEDITDILGCRVICFLSDEIDKIGKRSRSPLSLTGRTPRIRERSSRRIPSDISRFITSARSPSGASGPMRSAARSLRSRSERSCSMPGRRSITTSAIRAISAFRERSRDSSQDLRDFLSLRMTSSCVPATT